MTPARHGSKAEKPAFDAGYGYITEPFCVASALLSAGAEFIDPCLSLYQTAFLNFCC
jgi:hypothetical protein